MSAPVKDKSPLKQRDELDALLDGFEHDLTMRVDELVKYCNGYANSILSVTGAEDDPHVSNRINAILSQSGLVFDLAETNPSGPPKV